MSQPTAAEIEAKKAAGYFTDGRIPDSTELESTTGRDWEK